jgi:antitoxin component of RelBE/YafQ-DinJ toxin-antitoxin module
MSQSLIQIKTNTNFKTQVKEFAQKYDIPVSNLFKIAVIDFITKRLSGPTELELRAIKALKDSAQVKLKRVTSPEELDMYLDKLDKNNDQH